MKEDMLEVLIYLFENYVLDGLEFEPDHGELIDELVGAGFASEEVEKAFFWLEGMLAVCDADLTPPQTDQSLRTMRFFTNQEADRLGLAGQSLILRLERFGVLDQFSRETVIERVMALDSSDVNIEHIKWIILMVIGNQPDFDDWVEGMVTGEVVPYFH